MSFLSCKSQNCDTRNKKKIKKNTQILIPSHEETHYSKISEIPTPKGYERIKVDTGSYADYLRNLPLKEDNTVYYYDGQAKYNQNNQFAVVDIDVGDRDLQQCADAVMRLRAEYLYQNKDYNDIHFNFLCDGKPRYYTEYAGNDKSYAKFRKYMDYIFTYANTASLNKELQSVSIEDIQIGDVFIQAGDPYGHAITVVDIAENHQTDEKIFMIIQSFMPAQSIHVLKNLNNSKLSPWYNAKFDVLYTPEWIFSKNDIKRFKK